MRSAEGAGGRGEKPTQLTTGVKQQADDNKERRHHGDRVPIRTRELRAAGEMRRGRRAANGREGLKFGIISGG